MPHPLICCFLAPTALPLLGLLFFENFLKECGVVDRLANTAQSAIVDTATIFPGFTVGCSTQADVFLTPKSIGIFFLGAIAFSIATACSLPYAPCSLPHAPCYFTAEAGFL